MYIAKICNYKARVFNLIPAIVLTPNPVGMIIAFKMFFWHFGIMLAWKNNCKKLDKRLEIVLN